MILNLLRSFSFASLWFAFLASSPALAQDAPKIAGFEAHLFNSKTGLLSANMLAKQAPQFGNVPAGELASVSALIVVKVEFGKESAIPPDARARLIATEGGVMPFAEKSKKESQRVILDSTVRLGPVNADGSTYVGFWLANTGCKTISIRASLLGMKAKPTLTEILPFTCYE